MIDFVKVQLFVDPPLFAQTLIANGYEVSGRFNYDTSESNFYPLKAWNETLEVKFKSPNFIQLSGSIHKFAHDGVNHTDFYFKDVLETLVFLIDTLALSPHTSRFHNIEFGVNIKPPFATKTFLKQVLSYAGSRFTTMQSKDGNSLGIECQLKHFKIKMYCKKSQYKLSEECMRFEIHVGKMQYLTEKKIFVKFLKDLFVIENFVAMGKLLSKVFNEIVIIDKSIEVGKLSKSELKIYETWTHPLHVEELHASDIIKFQYQRRLWRKIQNNFSTERYQEKIAELIFEKINQLLTTDQKTSTIITVFKNRSVNTNFNQSYPSDKREDSLKTFSPFINDTAPKYVQQIIPPKEIEKPAEADDRIGAISNEPTLSIEQLRKQGKLIETPFLGTDGKFYIPNPIDPKRIAVYENPEAYNKRLHYPTYIDKEEAERFYLQPMPIDVQTLRTISD